MIDYLIQLQDQIAIVKELPDNCRLLAMAVTNQPLEAGLTTNHSQVIELWKQVEGNKMILNNTLLFLEDGVSDLYDTIY